MLFDNLFLECDMLILHVDMHLLGIGEDLCKLKKRPMSNEDIINIGLPRVCLILSQMA